MEFKKGVYLIWFVTFCCLLIYFVMMMKSIAEAQEEEEEPRVVAVSFEEKQPPQEPLVKAEEKIEACPPAQDEYVCPMGDDGETDMITIFNQMIDEQRKEINN